MPAFARMSDPWRIAAWIVLAILTVAMVLLVPRHEPWFDEAQAWLLARDASWWQVVWTYARYEGSPSLWHSVLMLPAGAGLPPLALNVISGGLALVGAALILFRSPIPPALRLLLPAGFFLFYQYGVVARSYALLMPLLWLTALAHPRRFERPWRFVGVLILVSQVSLHAAWIAGVLMAVFVGEAAWFRRFPMRRWWGLVVAFGANTAFIVGQLWPPPDLFAPPHGPAALPTWPALREMSLDAFSPWPWLSGLVLLGMMFFFFTRGLLLSYVMTSAGLLAIFAFKFFSIWHQGLLFALIVLHFWLAWASPIRRRVGQVSERFWPCLATGALAPIAAIHVWWAAMASWHDWEFPYSGSRDAAAYLQAHHIDRERIHIFKFSTCAVLLYLDHNPFANVAPSMPGSFWIWTREVFAGQTLAAITQGDPPWILVGAQLRPAIEPTPPPLAGYAIERVFPGRIAWKEGFYRTESYYLYRRTAPAAAR